MNYYENVETTLIIDEQELACLFSFEHHEAEKSYFSEITGHGNQEIQSSIEIADVLIFRGDIKCKLSIANIDTENYQLLIEAAEEFIKKQQFKIVEMKIDQQLEEMGIDL